MAQSVREWMSKTRREAIVVGVLAVLIAILLFANGALSGQDAAALAELRAVAVQTATLRQFVAEHRHQPGLSVIARRLPSGADVPGILLDTESMARTAGVRVQSLQFGATAPVGGATGTANGSTGAASGAAGTTSGTLQYLPVSLNVAGAESGILAFVAALEHGSRAMRVVSVALTGSGAQASGAIECQALFAGGS